MNIDLGFSTRKLNFLGVVVSLPLVMVLYFSVFLLWTISLPFGFEVKDEMGNNR